MRSIPYALARRKLAATMDRLCEDCAPITITRSGSRQAVVMMSLQEYQQLGETTHLLRSPANARRLVSAVESLAQQKGNVRTLKRSE